MNQKCEHNNNNNNNGSRGLDDCSRSQPFSKNNSYRVERLLLLLRNCSSNPALEAAIFEGQPICILPACAIKIAIVSDGDIYDTQAKSQGVIPEKSKEDLEKLKLSEKGRVFMGQTRSPIYVVEQAAMGTAIMNNNYISTGAARFSDVLDKASGSASELGIRRKD